MPQQRHTGQSSYTRPRAAGQVPSQAPIVLASLPRVGAVVQPQVESAIAQSVRPPDEVLPPPASLPQLELRDQIHDRIRLHVAESSTDPQPQAASPSIHFADRHRAFQSEPAIRQPAAYGQAATARVPSSVGNADRLATAAPVSFSDQLQQLHRSISPHAGLIVAFALVASAALLYWMIVGPSQTPGPLYHDSGGEFEREQLGATTQSMPEAYVPQFTAELPQAEPTQSNNNQWNRIELPQPRDRDDTPPALLTPTWEPRQTPTSAAVESSPYPKTQFPNQLDLSKAMQTPMSPANPDVARRLPEIANRSTDTTNR